MSYSLTEKQNVKCEYILVYSPRCSPSQRILDIITEKNLQSKMDFINIDENEDIIQDLKSSGYILDRVPTLILVEKKTDSNNQEYEHMELKTQAELFDFIETINDNVLFNPSEEFDKMKGLDVKENLEDKIKQCEQSRIIKYNY